MSDDSIKDALRLVPYGFYAITSRNGDDMNAMVANWVSQVSFDPRLVAVGLQKSTDIVADSFRQAGGHHPDDVRVVLKCDIVQSLVQVVPASEHGGVFAEIATGNIDRLLKVADHVAADIGAAPLRAMHERQASLHSLEC